MPVHEAVHERLAVGHLHPLFDIGLPQLDPPAVFAGEGHGIGQDVIQFGQGRPREAARPIAILGLHTLVHALAVELLHISPQLVVIAQHHGVVVLSGARVFDDAEGDPPLPRERQYLLDAALVQMNVEVDEREIQLRLRGRHLGRTQHPTQNGGATGQGRTKNAAPREQVVNHGCPQWIQRCPNIIPAPWPYRSCA